MVSRSQSASLRILVIRLSAMGDVAMSAPVVGALRKCYPEAQIVIMTPSFLQPFFRGIERIEFISPDFKGRHKGFRGLLRLSAELGKFDMVADLHDVIRTKMLRKVFCLRGAKVVHIDKGREEKKALVAFENKKLVQLKTTIERYREVFLKLGFDIPPIAPPQRVKYAMSPETAQLAGTHDGKWIGIGPFAQHQGKIYPLDHMEQVIAKLSTYENVRLFIFGGGPVEREYSERMEQTYPRVTSVIGRIKLGQEMELVSNLDMMVSMDSSSMHMASLVGVPAVSIWGATHPYAGFYGLGQDPRHAVQLDMACRPCSIYGNKPCVYGDYPCMKNIDPELVVKKVCEVAELG